MEHHSSKEAREAANQEGENIKPLPPPPSPTHAPPHAPSLPPHAPSPPPLQFVAVFPPQPAASFSSVNQESSIIASTQSQASKAIPLSVVPQYSSSSSTSSSQDEEDLANRIEVQSRFSSHDSNQGDKKTKPRTLLALARKRERERDHHETNPLNSPSINSYPNDFTNKLNVKRKLNFDYLPNDLCSNVSGSTHGKYVIPQLRTPQVMMLKESEEHIMEKPKDSTKIAYIHGKLQLTLETFDKIESPHEIDIFSGKLYNVIEKDYNKVLQKKDKINTEVKDFIKRYPCEDPGHFSLSVRFQHNDIPVVSFMDASSSINYMSKTLYDKLGFPPIKAIPLPNQKLIGVVDNVDIKISNLIYKTSFMIFDIPLSLSKEIVLGRPFLSASKAILNMHEGSITLHMGPAVRKLFMAWNLNNHICQKPTNGTYLEDLRILNEE